MIRDDFNQIYGEKDLIEQFEKGLKEGAKQQKEDELEFLKKLSNAEIDDFEIEERIKHLEMTEKRGITK